MTQTTLKRVHGCSATKQVHATVCAGLPLTKFGKKQLQRAHTQRKLASAKAKAPEAKVTRAQRECKNLMDHQVN